MIIIMQQQVALYGTNPEHKIGMDLIYKDNLNLITNKQKNIYDMGGNIREWTMEAYGSVRIARGATITFVAANGPASERGARDVTYNSDILGFRVTLYVK